MNKQAEEWRTVEEEAEKYGRSTRQIRRMITAGRLQTNGKRGRALRVRGRVANWRAVDGEPDEAEPLSEYDKARIEKTRALARIAELNVKIHDKQAGREYVEKLTGLFMQTFPAGMRKAIAALKLPKGKAAELLKVLDSCLSNFQAEITKELNGETQNEVTE